MLAPRARRSTRLAGRASGSGSEVILIVTRKDETQAVFDTVVKAARLAEPGRGFAYVQPVQQAVGFLGASSASGAP